jgi:hypothetical protein
MLPQLAVLVLAILVPADELDLLPALRSAIETTKAAAELLGGVKDAASAENAKPKLDEYAKQLEKLEKVLKPQLGGNISLAEAKLAKEYAKANDELAVAHDRIFAKQKPVYKLLAPTDLFKHVERSLEDRAALQCQNIQKAAMAWTTKAGDYPLSLGVLVVRDPVTGTLPFLEGGEKAIRDPWGKPIEFKVVEDDTGFPRFYVFTTSPYGKGGKLIQWPRETKK